MLKGVLLSFTVIPLRVMYCFDSANLFERYTIFYVHQTSSHNYHSLLDVLPDSSLVFFSPCYIRCGVCFTLAWGFC